MKNSTIYFGISIIICIFVIQKERVKQSQSSTESEFKSTEKESTPTRRQPCKGTEERELIKYPPMFKGQRYLIYSHSSKFFHYFFDLLNIFRYGYVSCVTGNSSMSQTKAEGFNPPLNPLLMEIRFSVRVWKIKITVILTL